MAEDVTVAVKITAAPALDGLFEETTVVELAALFTVCARAADELPAKFVSPPNTAVIVWAPPVSADVVNAAIPPLNVAEPRTVEASLNVTVPVGVPEPAVGFTVAVNVTASPKADGFSEEIKVTCVAGVESKLRVSMAKSVQVPTQVVILKTTEVMLAPDWSKTPI